MREAERNRILSDFTNYLMEAVSDGTMHPRGAGKMIEAVECGSVWVDDEGQILIPFETFKLAAVTFNTLNKEV